MNTQTKPKVGIVVGIAGKNMAIGNGGKLLVHISDDLKRFKSLTLGHAIILGRKTYESIGKALPGRQNFIVTRKTDLIVPDAIVCGSFEEAMEKANAWEMASPNENKEIFLVGGSEIYAQGLPFTDKIYLTIVKAELEGDVVFPVYPEFTKETFKEERFDEKTGLHYTWIDLTR